MTKNQIYIQLRLPGQDEQPPFWSPIRRLKWRNRHKNIARLEYELGMTRMPLIGDFPWFKPSRIQF